MPRPALRLVPHGEGSPRLYAHGILVPGLRLAIATPGGAVLLVIDPDAIAVEAPIAAAAEQDLGRPEPYGVGPAFDVAPEAV